MKFPPWFHHKLRSIPQNQFCLNIPQAHTRGCPLKELILTHRRVHFRGTFACLSKLPYWRVQQWEHRIQNFSIYPNSDAKLLFIVRQLSERRGCHPDASGRIADHRVDALHMRDIQIEFSHLLFLLGRVKAAKRKIFWEINHTFLAYVPFLHLLHSVIQLSITYVQGCQIGRPNYKNQIVKNSITVLDIIKHLTFLRCYMPSTWIF